MAFNPTQLLQLQTNIARDKAEVLLEGLRNARKEADRQAARHQSHLNQEQVRLGQLAIEQALTSTQNMIETLNEAMELIKEELDDDLIPPLIEPETNPADLSDQTDRPQN